MQTRAHLVGLVEKFCAQTQYTFSYTTELWATPPGLRQGRKEQRSTSEFQFIQSFTTVLQCCVGWFGPVDVFLKGEVNSADSFHTDGKLTAKESEMTETIPEPLICSWGFTVIFQVISTLLTNIGQETVLSTPAEISQTMGSAVPRYTCSSIPMQLHTKPATSEEGSLMEQVVHKHYFMSKLATVLKIYEMHFMFDTLYGLIMHTNFHSLLYPAKVLALVSQTCLQLQWWKVKNILKLFSMSLSVVMCTRSKMKEYLSQTQIW